jgi:hypothetical protein
MKSKKQSFYFQYVKKMSLSKELFSQEREKENNKKEEHKIEIGDLVFHKLLGQ